MKNKRMKLTALAMSVLMAMSTITSVTWAADLFTDGAPAEVVVEAPTEVISDVEETGAADDATLTGLSAQDIATVTFQYDNVGNPTKVVARIVFNNGMQSKTINAYQATNLNEGVIARSCTEAEHAIYAVQIDGMTFYSNEVMKITPVAGQPLVLVDVNCDYSVDPGKGYITAPSSLNIRLGHIPTDGTDFTAIDAKHPGEVNPETTTATGKGVRNYSVCSVCGGVIPDSGDLMTPNLKTPEEVFKDAANKITIGSTADGTPVRLDYPGSLDTVTVNVYDIAPITHNYDEAHPITMWGTRGNMDNNGDGYLDFIDGTMRDYYTYNVESYGGLSTVEDFAPYHCSWFEGKMVADNPGLAEQDAYYYTVVVCKECRTIKFWDKVYLKDTPGSELGTFYEEVPEGNIIGFFGKNRTIYYFNTNLNGTNPTNAQIITQRAPVGYRTIGDRKISVDDVSEPLEPIFRECGKMGFYDVKTYVTDTDDPTSSERKKAESNHSWGPVELAPKGTTFNGTVTATEFDKLLEGRNRRQNEEVSGFIVDDPDEGDGYVVVKDLNGNVTEAKSKDCITTAKYQLGRRCIECGTWIKEGDLKTADPNKDRHNWGDWSQNVDPADDKYYDLGNGTHKRFTYKHRTCTLCRDRDLKLNEEFVEAHKLVETKYDNDGEDETYVAPTCGTPGSYDVILRCACGFEDTESRKTTTIDPTDAHDFGDNPAELLIIGDIQVGGGQQAGAPAGAEDRNLENSVYARIVRKCINCGKYDANGINNTPESVGDVGVISPYNRVVTTAEGRTFSDYVPAKADPTTHIPYPCSVGQITVNFKWEGKVDGKATRLTGSKTVPYYINRFAFASARAHEPGEAVIENKVDATADTAGSYDKVLYCRVCGDEISRETITVDPEEIIPVPTAKATAVNYNTINITWNAVEGATSYDVYYRSAALGVNDWTLAKNVTGTSFNYSGLITGVKYRFTVSAVKGENSSEFGVNTSVATPKLAAPEVKTVTAVKKGTKVTWTKVDGANGYIIQSKTASGKWTRVGTVKKGAKVSWTDKKAASGTTYRVRAYRTVDAPNISKNNVYGPFSAAK